MTATNDEIMAELKALRAIVESLAPLRAMVDALLPGMPIATAMECAGPYGDPQVRFDIKNMPPMKGKRMSQLPANQLDALASQLAFFADKEEAEGKEYKGKPQAPRTRLDAARARRWALRRRMGWMPDGEKAKQNEPAGLGGGGGLDGGLGLSAPPAPPPPPPPAVDLADDDDGDGFDLDDDDGETPF